MSGKSKVYFTGLRTRSSKDSPLSKIKKIFDTAKFDEFFKKNDLTAVKVHFGEPGGFNHLRPVFVRAVVDSIKRSGAKPSRAQHGGRKNEKYAAEFV